MPFDSLSNVRDLGGYPTASGAVTNTGKFYRAPALCGMSGGDRALMLSLGIRCIIDLRTAWEVKAEPDPFSQEDGVSMYNISLIDNLFSGEEANPDMSLAKLYRHLVDNKKESLKEIFSIFSRHLKEGACLFHCTAGKDRTGIVAALLLLLAGVSDEDIIENYAATATLMRESFAIRMQSFKDKGQDVAPAFFSSSGRNIEEFTNHINTVYGGVAGYLSNIGLAAGDIDDIKNALVG